MAAKAKPKSKKAGGVAKAGTKRSAKGSRDTILFIHRMWGGGHQWRGWESGRVLFEIAYWFINTSHASRVDPGRVTVPTHTIACARDRITPKPVIDRIAARYRPRGGSYRVYDDHAHFIIAEDSWEAVAEDCATWIETAVGAKAEG